MKLKIGICEDIAEETARLLRALKRCKRDCETRTFASGEDFLKDFYPGRFDLILMDIYMKEINGVETVSRIRSLDQNVTVAFLTTSPDFTMQGYQYRVDRYIIKPIKQTDLEELLTLAERKKSSRPSITVSFQGKQHTIYHDDISYAEQDGHAVNIHLTNGEIQRATLKLSDLEPELPHPPFYRCHKSFIINLVQVRYLDKDLKAFIMNGGRAYIRRDSLREAREIYSHFMFDQVRGAV